MCNSDPVPPQSREYSSGFTKTSAVRQPERSRLPCFTPGRRGREHVLDIRQHRSVQTERLIDLVADQNFAQRPSDGFRLRPRAPQIFLARRTSTGSISQVFLTEGICIVLAFIRTWVEADRAG